MYLATRSERDGAPVLIWPVPIATTRSAIVVSSVSPERCDTTADQPAPRASSIASIVSVSVPIWLSLISTEFAAPSSIAARDALGVGHEQVVADELDAVAEPLGQLLPAEPVVLGQAVLDRDDRVAGGPVGPQVDQLAGLERPALLGQHVARRRAVAAAPLLDQLGRRRVERDRDVLAGPVAGPLDGAQDDLDRGLVRGERRREPALVALARREALVVEDRAQRGEDLGAGPQRLAVASTARPA